MSAYRFLVKYSSTYIRKARIVKFYLLGNGRCSVASIYDATLVVYHLHGRYRKIF